MTPPITTLPLFSRLDALLIALLRSLTPEQWQLPTIAQQWCVKDIAAHLLDGNLRTLSMLRDNYVGEVPENIASYQDLVAFLNRLNADWVRAMRRVSPNILIDLLQESGEAYVQYLHTLPPFGKAAWSVAWAGEEQSDNWFHIAREYTEKWHHQQQIRLAVGQEAILYAQDLYAPYLDTSMRALPHHYRNVPSPTGTLITVVVPEIGAWTLQKSTETWQLQTSPIEASVECSITLAPQIAWRLLTGGISLAEAMPFVQIEGNGAIGNKLLEMRAVMM